MPNYATNRLIISGPAAEIERFQTSCIRLQRDQEADEVGFDFEALVPMPPEIIATLDQRSDADRTRALAATGFDGWYDWSLAHWGTKWNSEGLAILHVEPELVDVAFDTAWTSPEPIFRALAAQYPQLKGYTLSTDPAEDWSLFGTFADGAYSSKGFDAAALRFLIEDCTLTPVLRQTSARALTQNWARITSSGPSAAASSNSAALATERVKAALPVDVLVRFEFAEHHACAEYLADCDSFAIGSSAAADLSFILAEDRSRTGLDRALMEELAAQIRGEGACGHCRPEDLVSFASKAAQLAVRCSEEKLRAWAAVALFRPGISLDMADSGTLQVGFAAYAQQLYGDALAHLNRRAAALALPAPTAAVLGA